MGIPFMRFHNAYRQKKSYYDNLHPPTSFSFLFCQMTLRRHVSTLTGLSGLHAVPRLVRRGRG